MPTSQGNHHPKPEPVKLGTSKKTYATAYAFRPPTDRYPNWTWRMRIHSEKKLQYISIGRLKRRDVLKKMDLAYQEAKPKDYVDHVEKTTFAEIIDMWYLDAVVPRLPSADSEMNSSSRNTPYRTTEIPRSILFDIHKDCSLRTSQTERLKILWKHCNENMHHERFNCM